MLRVTVTLDAFGLGAAPTAVGELTITQAGRARRGPLRDYAWTLTAAPWPAAAPPPPPKTGRVRRWDRGRPAWDLVHECLAAAGCGRPPGALGFPGQAS